MGAVEAVLGIPLSVIIVVILSAGTRIFIASEQISTKGVLSYIFMSAFTGFVGYALLTDLEYTKGWITFMLAIGCLIAKDIVEFILKLATQLKQDPLAIVRDFLNWKKGR